MKLNVKKGDRKNEDQKALDEQKTIIKQQTHKILL